MKGRKTLRRKENRNERIKRKEGRMEGRRLGVIESIDHFSVSRKKIIINSTQKVSSRVLNSRNMMSIARTSSIRYRNPFNSHVFPTFCYSEEGLSETSKKSILAMIVKCCEVFVLLQ